MSQMKMAELARRSELSVPTVKYYLREGLLHPGERTSVNQALYDDSHLERIRLVRALVTVAGLPLDKVKEVVRVVDSEPSVIDALAVTQDAFVGETNQAAADSPAADLLAQVVDKRGWRCHPESPAHAAAIEAVANLQGEELTAFIDRLDEYAAAADEVGRLDVHSVAEEDSLEATIRSVVLGSALRLPLFNALVLLAQQHYAGGIDRKFDDE
ncbi:MerR family transcriptional regulator [Corynebacterium lubricantis]|uniref:MerR family transcriptional regulator n=1 Tax=Corynebacterium lubricantis TaxID=541095 RepID=UPI00036909D0|nr:MerR family transcriptional regulator [Corynebacterium lubricantis]